MGGALGWGFGARDAAAFCVAGVAQPYIHLRFTWQAWHRLASTLVSRGRRGAHGIGWRAWVWFGRAWRRAILRGRRGTTLHPPSFHVAGVAQTRIYHRVAWQAWHSWHWVARLGVAWARVTPRHFAWQAWHNLTSTFVLRGRRGRNSHLPSFSVAGVALMALGGALGCGLGARDATAFCVAGVAQPHIHLRFTWQAWHKLASTLVSRGRRGTHGIGWRAWVCFGRGMGWGAWVWFGRAWRRAILRGRRGTTLHPPSFHVAGVAQTRIHLGFTWQARHSWHWVARLGVVWARVTPIRDQVPLLDVIIVGFVTVGQARLSRSTSRCTTWSTEDHGTPHSAHSRSAVLLHAGQMTLQRWQKDVWQKDVCARHCHTHHHNFVTHIHIRTYIHTYVHTYVHTYIHTYTFHFVTQNCFNFSILHRILCFSFLPRPRYNLWSSLLEEVDLWGYPVL